MIRLVVSCDAEGCDQTMTVELADDCYVTGGTWFTVDGMTQPVPERAWGSNGGAYPAESFMGEPPRRDFCPDHASEASS